MSDSICTIGNNIALANSNDRFLKNLYPALPQTESLVTICPSLLHSESSSSSLYGRCALKHVHMLSLIQNPP